MALSDELQIRRAKYQGRNVRRGLVLAAVYFLFSIFISRYIPLAVLLVPPPAIGIAALYFGGYELLPVIYCAALAGEIVASAPLASVALLPFVAALQTIAGAYAIRSFDIDPVFRSKRDALLVTLVACVLAVFRPVAELLLHPGIGSSFSLFIEQYVFTLTPLIITLPFLLRWLAKPAFKRTTVETIEAVLALGAVVVLACALFLGTVSLTVEIMLGALLLVPLFWIALRMRPRFVTLALMAVLIIASVDIFGPAAPRMLLLAQLYLIGISVCILVIATQEEERRVTSNIMLSQLGSLRNAQASLIADAENKKDFVAVLAHELRNPLAPVMSSIEFLKLKGPRDADEAEALSVMSERMSTVQQLLGNLLDVSRIWAGKMKLDPKVIDLRSALEAALLSTQHYRIELHQTVLYKKPPEPVWISGDRVRIEQVFSNLLANASKYSPSGSTISIGVRTSPASVQVDISDNGMGLRADELEVIFLPFRQADNGERTFTVGLGIGLALVKSFVELHGGTVSVTSEGQGRGSTFTVQLPVSHMPRDYEPRHTPLGLFARQSTESPLVLIADDNDAAAAALGRLLELLNYKVAYAYDGIKAVEMALELSPEAILLDVQLPKLDGHAVANKLHEEGYGGRIIALSGYAESDTRLKFPGASPFDHYLVKPASIEELRPVLPGF